VGTVLMADWTFARANITSERFHIQRWRWFWEAYEAIKAADDYIDVVSVERELMRKGRLQEATGGHALAYFLKTDTFHVEAYARRIIEMDERQRLLDSARSLARRAADLKTPLPRPPGPAKSLWTQEELAAAEFPCPQGPVPDLIPNGLTILGGRPKRGKSWLMLQAGCAVGLGGQFLGRTLPPGRALYDALEDTPRRLKERTARLGIPGHTLIHYALGIQPLHLGGMAVVEQAARNGGYSLIIIDTIRRAMPGKDFNKDGALFDDILGQLQSLAQRQSTAIVAVLHTRKGSAGFEPDPVDDVLGSTGLTASADCVLALYTEQGKAGATLKGRGRDLDDIDLALQFDPLTCAWQSLGESGQAL
jgi:hypothetical protein